MERFDPDPIPLPAAIAAGEFSSAQLIFYEVDHSGPSFEAPVFLAASDVDATTPFDPDAGFAGSFVIFGHGGCVGDEGHCDVPEKHKDPFDNRPLHALTPQTKTVDITEALKRILGAGAVEELQVSVLALLPGEEEARLGDVLFFSAMRLLAFD
jgi:hypothetical protein